MVKAKTMERLEEYRLIQKYAQTREQDIQLLQKHREERRMVKLIYLPVPIYMHVPQ